LAFFNKTRGPSWLWSYGNWIYNYLCNQCLSPVMWVRFSIRTRCTTLCDQVCQWLATGQWFSLVSSINKTDLQDIIEILLKVALNTINQTNQWNEDFSAISPMGDEWRVMGAWSAVGYRQWLDVRQWTSNYLYCCVICK
jgi:hypothetical protein